MVSFMPTNPYTQQPLDTLLADLRAAGSREFETACPIPPAVNHSLAFLEHEQRAVFQNAWVCVGRHDEIPGAGDFLTHEIGGVPVLVVRQADGAIRAFVNACAHRYACLVDAEKGSAKKFTCRYHAWTYDPAGRLIRAPYMEMKPDFDCAQHRLRDLPCEVWEGFVYVSLNQNPEIGLQQALNPFRERVIGRYDMAAYRSVLREHMAWNANWKNLIENFIESYHVPIAHGKTFAQHEKRLEDYVCGEDSVYYCYHYAAQDAGTGLGAAHPDNQRLEGEWRRTMVDFCVFPCHLVTVMPDYLWYISVQPDGVDRMRATWGLAVPPEVLADVGAEEYDAWLDEFRRYMIVANDEDKILVEALHRGSGSPLLPRGTYHPIERNLWQFTRYLAGICTR